VEEQMELCNVGLAILAKVGRVVYHCLLLVLFWFRTGLAKVEIVDFGSTFV
jgi:hypothetical protein